MTDSFGTRLRRERERRQITLAEIAERTKVKASLYEALERDDASRWPSGIFRRAFVRGYAAAVGLDAEAVVREFLEHFPDPDTEARDAGPASAAALPSVSTRLTSHAEEGHASSHGLRLTLVETGAPFTGGRFLSAARQRWAAAAWDTGSLIAIAVTVFVFLDSFWMPFGITALCYYVGGVLVLGNSPGVCLFAPKPSAERLDGPPPARQNRTRRPEQGVRAPESSYRTLRFRSSRNRHIHG